MLKSIPFVQLDQYSAAQYRRIGEEHAHYRPPVRIASADLYAQLSFKSKNTAKNLRCYQLLPAYLKSRYRSSFQVEEESPRNGDLYIRHKLRLNRSKLGGSVILKKKIKRVTGRNSIFQRRQEQGGRTAAYSLFDRRPDVKDQEQRYLRCLLS